MRIVVLRKNYSFYNQKDMKRIVLLFCFFAIFSLLQATEVATNHNIPDDFQGVSADTSLLVKTRHSVGLIFGYSILPGITYKYRPTQHFSLETDFNPKLLITGRLLSEKANHIFLYVVELSENALYQHSFAEKNNISYQYIFGGGVNGAVQPFSPVIWKVGANAFAGVEFVFLDRPISMQVDFRPGYGLLLRSAKTIEEQNHYWNILTPGLKRNPQGCFDWSLNFSIRFYKKDKYKVVRN